MPRVRVKADQLRAAGRAVLRQRRRIRLWSFAGLALLLTLSALDHGGAFGYSGDDWVHYHRKSVTITSIISGDQLHVRTADGSTETDVKLIGLDAPQPTSAWHDRSLAYTRARTEGKNAVLRLDTPQTRDASGKLLAYVYLLDKDNLNLDMAHDGMAYVDHRYPFSQRTLFDITETEARKKERGLWKNLKFNDMPTWRQAWVKELQSKRLRPSQPASGNGANNNTPQPNNASPNLGKPE